MNHKPPTFIILDNIRSGYNVGAIFRTCDAFAVTQLLLCGITPKPPHREILKTALGSTEFVRWQHLPSTEKAIAALKTSIENILIVALETSPKALPLDQWTPPKTPLALIVGNEITGIDSSILQKADLIVQIPMFGRKKSLNVSVATGIALWHLHVHWKLTDK